MSSIDSESLYAAQDPAAYVAEQLSCLTKSPLAVGLALPPEWTPHRRTWLSFPHHRTDFRGRREAVIATFAEIARVISEKEKVALLVNDQREAERARRVFEDSGVRADTLEIHQVPTNRSWNRDSLPIWLTGQGKRKCAVKFQFNGWARYRDHQKDDAAGCWVAAQAGQSRVFPRSSSGQRWVLEGGSIDVDEFGTLLTTSACLMTSARARFKGLSQAEVEDVLASYLGIKSVIWLPDGITGDDTSGHVDDFARFAPQGKVLVCQESKKSDLNHAPLKAAKRALNAARNACGQPLELIELPMPKPILYRSERLPASYANFYVANAAVLVPVFNDPHDQEALSLIADAFPDRPIVGIYARDLVIGLGTIHCSTMQEPV